MNDRLSMDWTCNIKEDAATTIKGDRSLVPVMAVIMIVR